tara:strand:+ start:3987 stop:4550 length:564 start_codon:yes stop_codon:yes gene_type:complete
MSTIYLDMDGVLVDFFGGIELKYGVDHWKSIQDREIKFLELHNTDFFHTLPIFREDRGPRRAGASISCEIHRHVKSVAEKNGMSWGICTSPLRGDRDNSAYWKRRWLEDKRYMPDLVENLIITSNKHKYAWNKLTRRPNILIDDKLENIKRWNDAGGIGIRFQTNEDDLEEYLFVELEKAIERSRNP